MTLNITCEIKPDFKFHYKELACRVIEKSLESEGFPYEAEISLTLTGNDQIREINSQTRQIDRPTDVLSFPMYEADEEIDDFELVLFGDIVISLERAEEQRVEYGHTLSREVLYLFCHGLLHLCGYDHENEEDKAQMRKREEEILDLIGQSR